MESKFAIGDVVTTDFYVKDAKLHRVITNIENKNGQTGIFITTVDKHGRKLHCDSGWYEKLNVSKADDE